MIRGHYIAATGMMLQRRKMEVITNNITNVETSGYKKDDLISVSFDDVMIERIHDNVPDHRIVSQRANVGPLNFGTHVDYIQTNFTQGNLETTELATDLAIVGDAYFVLDTPQGPRYSRSGALAIDVDGYLCNPDGFYVLGENGRIHVGSADFAVDEDGNISSADGTLFDRLNLVSFADANVLRKEGHNLYSAPEGEAQQAQDYGIRQYVLENSNVDIAREMVDMMTVYRAYESNQRMLTMIDETLGKAVNDIGRLR